MSTSNLAKAIGTSNPRSPPLALLTCCLDSAFVDRADIIQYVDLPPREAIYEILRTCLSELVTKGIVADVVRLMSYPLGLDQL